MGVEGQLTKGGGGAREIAGGGGHIGDTLNIGRAWVVRDGIGSTGGYHGGGELGRARLHELARIAMMSTMSRWSPVSGHPAMVVTIEVQF